MQSVWLLKAGASSAMLAQNVWLVWAGGGEQCVSMF